MGVAAVEPHGGTVPADDNSVAVVLDLMNPIGPDRRPWSFNRLSGDDEPGRKGLDFHCREKIGRRHAGNNGPGVVLSLGVQLLPPTYPITLAQPTPSAWRWPGAHSPHGGFFDRGLSQRYPALHSACGEDGIA